MSSFASGESSGLVRHQSLDTLQAVQGPSDETRNSSDLREALRVHRPLILAGAGISIALSGKRRASWLGLLAGIVEGLDPAYDAVRKKCRRILARLETGNEPLGAGEPSQAASLIDVATVLERELHDELYTMIDRHLSPLPLQHKELAYALRDLSGHLVTTNYDLLLARSLCFKPITWLDRREAANFLAARRLPHEILHLHGSLGKPDSIVFGRDSYERILGDEAVQLGQHAAPLSFVILLVGCGNTLDDRNLGAALDQIYRMLGNHQVYLLYCDEDEFPDNALEQRTRAVRYGARFSDLYGYLRELVTPVGAPKEASPITSRSRLQEALDSKLHTRAVALTGLRGAGGMGKTTLAADYCRRNFSRYARIYWVDYRSGSSDSASGNSTSAAVEALRLAMDIKEPFSSWPTAMKEPVEKWKADFRRSEDRSLVVLDNVDHPDSEFLSLIKEIGQHEQVVSLLITTRDPVLARHFGAGALPIEHFTDDEAHSYLAQRLKGDHRFQLDSAIDALARKEEYVPKLLELAVAALTEEAHATPLPEFLSQPTERAKLHARLQSDTSEIRLLRALVGWGVGPGATLEMLAATVCLSTEEALASLTDLEALTLVDQRSTGRFHAHQIVDDETLPRFRFEARAAVAAAVNEAISSTDSSTLSPESLTNRDLENAARAALETENLDWLREIVRFSFGAWRQAGPWKEVQALLSQAVSISTGSVTPAHRADYWYLKGRIEKQLGAWKEARPAFLKAMALFKGLEDKFGEAKSLAKAAFLMRVQGDSQAALANLKSALELLESVKGRSRREEREWALAHAERANTHRDLKEFQEAERHYRTARETLLELGDHREVASLNRHWAMLKLRRGDIPAASSLIERAKDHHSSRPSPAKELARLCIAADVALAKGHREHARKMFKEVVRRANRLNDRYWKAEALLGQAATYRLAHHRDKKAQEAAEEYAMLGLVKREALCHAPGELELRRIESERG